jgi:putative ABC transport system permease protein
MSKQRFFERSFRLLRSFCPPHLLEEIEGDLLQKFEQDVKLLGERKARKKLLLNVIKYFRPGIVLRGHARKPFYSWTMMEKNLLLAFRHIRKDGVYSAVNMFGLSVSLAVCLIIFQYSFFELSYDHQFSTKICRLGSSTFENGIEKHRSSVLTSTDIDLIKNKLPEIAASARVASTSGWFDCSLSYEGEQRTTIFNENNSFYFVDEEFLRFFECKFSKGDRTKALSKPFSLVLTETTARKYFGEEDPIGKTLRLRGSFQTHDYLVTGVIKNFPENSHLSLNVLASISSFNDSKPFDTRLYVELNDHANLASLTQKTNQVIKSMKQGGTVDTRFFFEPIQQIHLYSKVEDLTKQPGSATTVYALLAVSIILLVIAWINYINLSASRAVTRAKEVGIRKATGATVNQIMAQFITESLVVHVISLLLAIVIFAVLSPYFYSWIGLSHFANQNVTSYLTGSEYFFLLLFLAGIILTGVLPVQIVSRLNPIRVLKGKWISIENKFSFRKAAVVFQFGCAFALSITIIVFQKQFEFMKKQDIGVEISRSLVVKAPTNVDSSYLRKMAAFKENLRSFSILSGVSTSAEVPGNFIGDDWGVDIRRKKGDPSVSFGVNVIDTDFISLYRLKLLAGRDFILTDFPGQHFGTKVEPIILNRKAITRLGYDSPENAINEVIFWGENRCRVVGVIEDFHQRSVKEAVIPILFTVNNGPAITMKLTQSAEKNWTGSLKQIQEAWNHYFPNNAFDYFFLEDHFNEQYGSDERLGKLFNVFCFLTIVISFLGLFALTLFSFNLRLKEITIRKVLGASTKSLINLLSKEYMLLVLIAMAVSIPLASWAVSEWLNSFALRVDLNYKFLLIPVSLIILSVAITLVLQIMRVSVRSSVQLLKEE